MSSTRHLMIAYVAASLALGCGESETNSGSPDASGGMGGDTSTTGGNDGLGGANTGGANTGGNDTGGTNTGGANTGGNDTGGMGGQIHPDDDADGDGVKDADDAFPNDPNESVDTDGDGTGDNGDNCQLAYNPAQVDQDDDSLGDLCDATPCAGNTCLPHCTALLDDGHTLSGEYAIDPAGNGTTMAASCDMQTDGGGWTLVLNYLHKGGTNPDLHVRSTDLPLDRESSLGDDESGSAFWGHTSNALFDALGGTELRFFAKTSNHQRVIDFKTYDCIGYFATGGGRCSLLMDDLSTPLAGHGANVPEDGRGRFADQGDLAMTAFPFYGAGSSHWGIKGLDDRWEVDDFVDGFSADTWHQIWARSLPDSDGDKIADAGDNCPITPNPTQIDQDSDGEGNACDATACGPSSCPNDCKELFDGGNDVSGDYWIDPQGGGKIPATCDMETADGGWTLVLNYLHAGGTNPVLQVRTDLPLLAPGKLGDDQSGTTAWGHAAPAMMNKLGSSELRFYATTTHEGRYDLPSAVNFIDSACMGYFKSGVGNCGSLDGATILYGNNGFLPDFANSYFSDQGSLAMTEFPFYEDGYSHWGIRGQGHRWEVNDFADGYGYDTWHQIWTR